MASVARAGVSGGTGCHWKAKSPLATPRAPSATRHSASAPGTMAVRQLTGSFLDVVIMSPERWGGLLKLMGNVRARRAVGGRGSCGIRGGGRGGRSVRRSCSSSHAGGGTSRGAGRRRGRRGQCGHLVSRP